MYCHGASEFGVSILSLPKLFEIRWTEFSFTLIKNILVSWNALVIFFQRQKKDAQAAGFYKFLTDLQNLKMISFLTDLLFLVQRFHKKTPRE